MLDAPEVARAYCMVCRQFFISEYAYLRHRDSRVSTLTLCVPMPDPRRDIARSSKPRRRAR